jgi:osmotically-inducible protein OsmY
MDTANRERLIERMRAELERDTRVNLRRASIDLIADGDALRLEGEVPDLQSKRIAANVARQLTDSRARIEDHLAVATESRGDDELARRLGRHLTGEPVFREYGIVLHDGFKAEVLQRPPEARYEIELRVEDGIVTLSGTVGTLTHRRLAEVLCWWTAGCRRVDNRLEVEPEQDDTDDLLTDAVRIVLEMDPMVDATQLKAATAAGIVELSGLLPNEDIHRLVVRDAWAVPGVWDIYDRIDTGRGPVSRPT